MKNRELLDLNAKLNSSIEEEKLLVGQHWPDSTLYVVATPIGNITDLSPRARYVLSKVDLIAAEDTRHSGSLLRQFSISTPLIACHDHNELEAIEKILHVLSKGKCVALISDAGTPLISDPGYKIVCHARDNGYQISPIPGACAMVTALSAAGMPTNRFSFEGFLPPKKSARENYLKSLVDYTGSLIFYESPHRVLDAIGSMAEVLGRERKVVLARELTKRYETFISGTLESLLEIIAEDKDQQRGEMVIIVEGRQGDDVGSQEESADRILSILLEECSVKQATALAVKITGLKKNYLYQRAMDLSKE